MISYDWLVVLTILKNISQWEGLSHTLWNIKKVPNRQPEMISYEYSAWWFQPQMLSPILDPSLWFLDFVDGIIIPTDHRHIPDYESGSGDTWGCPASDSLKVSKPSGKSRKTLGGFPRSGPTRQ
jgi:hypothetical protein